MKREIIYGKGKTWAPHCESNFEIILRVILLFIYKTVKMALSITQKVFPNGIDGKTIIKR